MPSLEIKLRTTIMRSMLIYFAILIGARGEEVKSTVNAISPDFLAKRTCDYQRRSSCSREVELQTCD